MNFKKLLGIASVCALALGGAACETTIETGPVIVNPDFAGTLTLTWTVDGSDDPAACVAFAAYDLEIVAYDDQGNAFFRTLAPCEDFAVTISLGEGFYSIDATLLDPGGNSVSTTLPLEGVEIVRDTDLVIDIDFPVSSIL